MKPRKSIAPDFVMGSAVWSCWVTSDGQRFVWRAASDRLVAGRHLGTHTYWARVDGRELPIKSFPTLKEAMLAAYRRLSTTNVKKYCSP